MNSINLTIPISSNTDINAFIEYWHKIYAYKNEHLYFDNILAPLYTSKNITQLFEWKNGSTLSNLKGDSLTKNILSRIDDINGFKQMKTIDTQKFLISFQNINGAVWKIFLLHIIKPNEFPIYDQHIHRAYNYIHKLPIDITNNIKQEHKLEFYFDTYLPFIQSLEEKNLRKIDMALFAFGKLLNTPGYKEIVLQSAPKMN